MATFNYILGPKKNDGQYPIYLKICNGKTNTMRSMDIAVAKSEWNSKGQRIGIRRTDTYEVRSEKEILKERGMKMKDLAEQMDIAPETLTRVIRGNPQYSTLKTIADTLGVSVRDLFKDKDVKTTDNEMKGCIFYNGEIHTFNTRGEIEIFLKGN